MSLLYVALSVLVLAAAAVTAFAWVSTYRFRAALGQPRAITTDASSLLWTGVRSSADKVFFSSGVSFALFLVAAVFGVSSLENGVQPVPLVLLGIVASVSLVGASASVSYYRLFDKLKTVAAAEQKAFLALNGFEQEGDADLTSRFPAHAEAAVGDGPDSPAFTVKRLSDGATRRAFFRLRGGKLSFVTGW